MKTFYTSVVELRQEFPAEIATHPYECGWADEALFFVESHDLMAGNHIRLRVQLSPDGIRWQDEGTVLDFTDSTFARVTHFGGFLRLVGTAVDPNNTIMAATISVRLALKG